MLAGLLIFAASLFVSVTRGIGTTDESWFLQVINRTTAGEVLYRDVFFHVTPLSVYVTAAFASLFGAEMLVVKVVAASGSALTILLARRIARQLGSSRRFPFLLVTALFVYAPHNATTLYTTLADVFLLASFSAVLSCAQSQKRAGASSVGWPASAGSLAIAAVAAGLSFVAKQNLGLYTLAALLISVIIVSVEICAIRSRLLTAVLVVLALFLFTVFLFLLPVWLSGGLVRLLDYGFASMLGTVPRLGIIRCRVCRIFAAF